MPTKPAEAPAQDLAKIPAVQQAVSRVDVLEKAQIITQPQGERLTRLEEKVVSVQATANRIEMAVTALTALKTR